MHHEQDRIYFQTMTITVNSPSRFAQVSWASNAGPLIHSLLNIQQNLGQGGWCIARICSGWCCRMNCNWKHLTGYQCVLQYTKGHDTIFWACGITVISYQYLAGTIRNLATGFLLGALSPDQTGMTLRKRVWSLFTSANRVGLWMPPHIDVMTPIVFDDGNTIKWKRVFSEIACEFHEN
jgi:hypothetical protein